MTLDPFEPYLMLVINVILMLICLFFLLRHLRVNYLILFLGLVVLVVGNILVIAIKITKDRDPSSPYLVQSILLISFHLFLLTVNLVISRLLWSWASCMQIAILRLKKMVVHISIGTMTLLNLVTFALQVYFQIRGIHSAGESLTGDGIPFQYLAGRFFMFIISFLLLFRIVILLWLRYSVPQLRMEEYREKRVQLRRLTLFSVISLFIGPCVSLALWKAS
ncbi:MAG: hypothetical protein DHS80DRAFT_30601 [Piptocephalis tieghemiana]|nr:MAG: hypothetical protein DHS80DRAFT_30601 [Piptocephalis tieghemiana]